MNAKELKATFEAAKMIAVSVGIASDYVEPDFDLWLQEHGNAGISSGLFAVFTAQYITSALTDRVNQRPEFIFTYAEYAQLTKFLPNYGGKDMNVSLRRNDNNDLLIEMEGETNITQFNQ